MPNRLESGILYVSAEFEVAGHLCPCGCGNKIITPLGPRNWSLKVEAGFPTLYPSIGNWQLPCKSHYWIIKGVINWSDPWSEDKIINGRKEEEFRRQLYYAELNKSRKKSSILTLFLNWLLGR